jgi:hypothetical protein
MKTYLVLVILTAATLWSGCAFGPRNMVLEPIGPSPGSVPESNGEGSLVVYTAYEVNAVGIGNYEERPHYSDYNIFTEAGKLQRTVHNNVGTVAEEAAHVTLPAGTYRVVADANAYGIVTVPVVIGSNRQTVVHLEGGASLSDMATNDQAGIVRFPDGEIVGWRAQTPEAAAQQKTGQP